MRENHNRTLLLGAAGGFIVGIAAALVLAWRYRTDPSVLPYMSLVVSASSFSGTVLAPLIREALRGKVPGDGTDQLASVVEKQWKQAAGKRGLTRALIPVTWSRAVNAIAPPASAADKSSHFDPLPRLTRVNASRLTSGQVEDLYDLYGGLPSGRLVIAGKAGAGKTSAAISLVLEALERRQSLDGAERNRVPVPVMFTLQAWNPSDEKIDSWLVRKIQDTYPQFSGRRGRRAVSGLLAAGKIAVVLDGLDEISPKLRFAALDQLSEQDTFRLVLLSRSREMANISFQQQGILTRSVAVELQPIGAAEASGYLRNNLPSPAPPDWEKLFERMRSQPDDPLSLALSTPLALSLVRETYRGQDSDIRDLMRFRDDLGKLPRDKAVEKITDLLLDRVLPDAYKERPEEPLPYDLDTARRTLTRVAEQMAIKPAHAGSLHWWQIPDWVPRKTHIFASVIAGAVIAGMVGLGIVGLTIALGGGLAHVVPAGLISKAALPVTIDIPKGAWVWFPLGLSYGLSVGLVDGVVIALAAVLARPIRPEPGEPRFTAERGRRTGVAALVAGVAAGVLPGLGGDLVAGPGIGLGSAFLYLIATAALTVGLAYRPRNSGPPLVGHNLQFKKPFWKLARAIVAGIATTLLVYTVAALLDNSQYRVIGAAGTLGEGLAFGIPAAFLLYILSSLNPDPNRDDSLDPASSRRGNQHYGRLAGLTAGLVVGLAAGLADGTVGGPVLGLASGLGFGSGFGTAAWLASARGFSIFVASLYLHVTWKTPVRLTRFLEDAYGRNVLRSVGPTYQFRHSSLQNRLAGSAIPAEPDLRLAPENLTQGAVPQRMGGA